MNLAIACDHAGYELKEKLIVYLKLLGHKTTDFGTHSSQSMDYPDAAHPLAEAVEKGGFDFGITICGSGNGINMTANKHQGIRAALCWNPEISALARQHNNANVCSLPARFIDYELATKILDAFLTSQFEGGRHQTRIDKIPLK
ncbi:MAG TPA: ribose 5-phosphate isomerase B [Marinilabiliales bacterium]|nr:MAG: ribose 5-phosphate isomerase B [Bacteroidetes bacterium GWA2_40_14]OFX57489.1 MAG: ribose 5-phosphate isomerase B [Bacteroidetes bacterium GWC2_40_13]OFX71713.1 MAG: ribose 5-phosphate isomerase B [Bacteroidetes bacterium GWD2_40_43]OFX90252.1 MAG: ribose 5-phosphate isomerase B [Bacteroidetes bacterium GWE2_40_63]OFY22090.1 MAG: ribose 5-phosphate isomerase B [Bacteroidetes bacterium GWF2_40_13]OFZ27715.1 MAG: ribose 5-phosphate isomerase B [Bacteroidetes bacterium RIFOXYC2_FULL_40_12